MILTLNTNNNTIVVSRYFNSPVESIFVDRHNSGLIQIGFTDMPKVALGSRMVEFVIKPHKDYNYGSFLVFANSYNLDGSYYNMEPNFNVAAIQEFFPLSALSAVESVLLSMQIRWSDDSGLRFSYSNIVDVEVNASLFTGTETLSSIPLSSLIDFLIPTLASWTWPINIFDAYLTLNDSNLIIAGSGTGILMGDVANFINLSGVDSWVNVNGSIHSNTLSTDSINTTLLSATTIYVNNEVVQNLSATNVNVGTVNALSAVLNRLAVANLSTVNIITNTLSGANAVLTNAVINNLDVANITAITETVGTLKATTVNASALSTVSLSVNLIVFGTAIGSNIISPNLYVSNLSSNAISNTTVITTSSLQATVINTNILGAISIATPTLIATNVATTNLSAGIANVSTIGALSSYSNYIQSNGNTMRILSSFTPTGTADATGTVGMFTWDNNFWYIKTNIGWRRGNLGSF